MILLWGGLEYFYRSTETNYSYKHKYLTENYEKIEILILGDSHSLFGINPKYFSKHTFNLSNISQSLYFDELLLNAHIDQLSVLKTVVLNVSYFSLSQEDNSTEDAWRKYFYKDQMQLDVPIVSNYNLKSYSLSLTRRFNKSVDLVSEYFFEGSILGCDLKGYGLQDESNIVEDKDKLSPSIARKHENGSLDFLNNTNRLQRMIEICNKKGVEVVLVELPVYKTYYKLLNSEKKNKIIEACKKLEAEYENVNYINLSQNELFEDSDLRDADHLTNEGAEKCSIFLNNSIENNFDNNKNNI